MGQGFFLSRDTGTMGRPVPVCPRRSWDCPVGNITIKFQTFLIAPSNVYSDQSFESWMKDGSHFDFIGQKREKLI